MLTVTLPPPEYNAVQASAHPDEMVVELTVDTEAEVVRLVRGDGSRLVVGMRWFTRGDPPRVPDFDDPRLVDYGQAIEFGPLDASVDALLYDLDPDYRRRAQRRQVAFDDSFGAALRRARLARRLDRDAFGPVSADTIRAIEEGEREPPTGEMLERIAEVVALDPATLATY